MTSQLPVACSLSAAELPQRLAEMRAIGETSFVGAEIDAQRALIRFEPEQDLARRLEDVVDKEAECCSFLAISVADREGELELEIVAPDGAEELLEDFVAAFSGQSPVTA